MIWKQFSLPKNYTKHTPIYETIHTYCDMHTYYDTIPIYETRPSMKLVSVIKDIDQDALEQFLELFHNTPYLSKACIFARGIRSSMRSEVFIRQTHALVYTKTQFSTVWCSMYLWKLCYWYRVLLWKINGIRSIQKLLFIFSVRYTNTMEQNGTVIAENGFTGCHFSICVYHNESNSATYGDSLGWPAPRELIQKIQHFVKGCFEEPENILLRECNNSNNTKQGSHVCKNDCCVYLLQKEGNIYDIYIVVASIVCLTPRFWEYVSVTKCIDRKRNPWQ